MIKKPLLGHLATYYNNKQLRPELRASLLDAIEKQEPSPSRTAHHGSRLHSLLATLFSRGFIAYASLLLCVGYILLMLTNKTYMDENPVTLAAAICKEISMNHHKKFNVEFTANTTAALNAQMKKLDFQILNSERIGKAFTINGARYCSLRGRVAVQIQLANADGLFFTLYQTKLVPTLAAIHEETVETDDALTIKLWQENGVFFGFAASTDYGGSDL